MLVECASHSIENTNHVLKVVSVTRIQRRNLSKRRGKNIFKVNEFSSQISHETHRQDSGLSTGPGKDFPQLLSAFIALIMMKYQANSR